MDCFAELVCSSQIYRNSLTGFHFTCWLDFSQVSVFIPLAKQNLDLFSRSGISDDADYKWNRSKSPCFRLSFLGRHRGPVPEMIFSDRLVPVAKLDLMVLKTDAHMWLLQDGCLFLEPRI